MIQNAIGGPHPRGRRRIRIHHDLPESRNGRAGQQAVRRAVPVAQSQEDFSPRHSPHHGDAPFQSGVEIAVIALWLGHESLDTTHMYIQADLKTKEQALGKLQPVEGGFPRFKPDDALLAFLSAL